MNAPDPDLSPCRAYAGEDRTPELTVDTPHQEATNIVVARLNHIYTKAIETGQLDAALRSQRALAKLIGLVD